MLDQAVLDCIAQKVIKGDVSLVYIDAVDKRSWLKSKDGEIDELVTDDELIAIIDNAAERKFS